MNTTAHRNTSKSIRQFSKESFRSSLRARYNGELTREEPETCWYAHGQLDGVVPGKVGVKIVLFKSGGLSYRLCKIAAPYCSSPDNKWKKNQVFFLRRLRDASHREVIISAPVVRLRQVDKRE